MKLISYGLIFLCKGNYLVLIDIVEDNFFFYLVNHSAKNFNNIYLSNNYSANSLKPIYNEFKKKYNLAKNQTFTELLEDIYPSDLILFNLAALFSVT